MTPIKQNPSSDRSGVVVPTGAKRSGGISIYSSLRTPYQKWKIASTAAVNWLRAVP